MKEKNKIGILTLTPTSNYGGILQSIALYHFLEREGYDVRLINKKFKINSIIKKTYLYVLQRLPGQNLRGFRKSFLKSKALAHNINNLIPKRTKKLFNLKSFREHCNQENYDAVIVGSDQVWRYSYINDGSFSCYFLDFNKKLQTKKISYAASFGSETWENKETESTVKSLLKDFDSISCREESGVNLCKDLFDVKAAHVLDPTLLLSSQSYSKIFSLKITKESKTLCTYILDNNKKKCDYTSKISENNSLSLIALNGSNSIYGLDEWVAAIKNSKLVITDSFHGMVFSIIFRRQFIVIGNRKRGLARFESLLLKLGLQDRLIEADCLDDSIDLVNTIIDYDQIEPIIEREKKFSEDFLKNSLIN